MRVLQVHTTYREAGGEDVAVEAEATILGAAGHAVIRHVEANPEGAARSLAALAVAPWSPGAASAVREAVARAQPDVASVHNTWYAQTPSVVRAIGRAGVPIVMTLHNYRLLCPASTMFHHGRRCDDCVGTHPWHAVAHRCYRGSAALSAVAAATVESWTRSGALDHVTRFVVMTEGGREVFVRGGIDRDRIIVRPHGLPDPGGPIARPSSSDRLVFVGRAVPEKGIGALLDWWGRRPRVLRLDVVGAGEVVDAWRGREPAGVRLLGALDRPRALEAMRGARAVVVPSLWDEPFGLVAVEAMACGVGVLTTGTGGLADIHGEDGGWVAPLDGGGGLDPAAWDAALDVLADDAVVDAAGRAARARYEARFTEAEASRSLLEVYRTVLAAR